MKVSVSNYIDLVAQKGIPAPLQTFHDQLIVEAAENNWAAYYADKDVKDTVDLYFTKYEAAFNLNQPAPQPQQAPRPQQAPQPQQAPKQAQAPKQQQAKQAQAPKQAKAPKTVKAQVVQKPKATVKVKRAASKAQAPKQAARKIVAPTGKKVKAIRSSTRFIQRFLELLNRKVKLAEMQTLLRSLQVAIVQGKIKKNNRNADNIRIIQENLVKVCNSGNSVITLTLPNNKMGELAAVAGGERVYPSLVILRKFIRYTGRDANKEQLENLLEEIKNGLKSTSIISEKDPFRAKVVEIRNTVTRMLGKGTLKPVSSLSVDLRGIEETIEGCDCGYHQTNGFDGFNGDDEDDDFGMMSGNIDNFDLNGSVMSAQQMMNYTYQTIDLPSPFNRLIGNPAENFTMMISGAPGSGKSTYSLAFAVALANFGKNVMYLTAEEYGSLTLQDRLQRVGGYNGNKLSFSGSLTSFNPAQYDVLFIDSLKVAKIDVEEIRELRKKYPRLAIVAVQQNNKQGQASGANDLPHEFDIVANVTDGVIRTSKNRYGAISELRIM